MSDAFATAVVRWQKRHGRHHLPWQADTSPYSIWLSEVMLQQTQATTVAPYYSEFMRRWPRIELLARATSDEVMAAWSGLGYYARARNLHEAAKTICHRGLPQSAEEWQQLPGVGKSTAAAIAIFSQGERAAILDGNVKRVLARAFAVETPINTPAGERELWSLAESLLPRRNTIRAYSQGMMDLGALVCVRGVPKCEECPLSSRCESVRRGITDELPRRQTRRPRPLKKIVMALVRHNGQVWLERRPPRGIWGGLWSLPQNESAVDLRKECESRLGCGLVRRAVGEFHHGFTHYELRARVMTWECTARPETPDNTSWISRSDIVKTALPSPIKKYLEEAGWTNKKQQIAKKSARN